MIQSVTYVHLHTPSMDYVSPWARGDRGHQSRNLPNLVTSRKVKVIRMRLADHLEGYNKVVRL